MASTTLTNQRAPCGRDGDCQCHEDRDDDGLIVHDLFYACGCRSLRHEFHDGSMMQRIVDHHGHVLLDEFLSEHS